ncbi:MAG: hypothetical protein WCK51_07120 [Armatimonadota bacterium]
MISTTIATGKLSRAIRRWTIGVGAFFSASCLFVSGSAIASMINASTAKAQIVGLEKDIANMEATIEQSKKLTVRMPKRKSASRIQAVIDEAAMLNGCRLVEFQTAPDLQPYASRYTTAEVKGWTQVTVQFQLDGTFTGVFEVIRTLCSAPDPVEVDSIDINEGRTKQSEVNAKVTLRVLKMEVKS